MLIMRYSIFTTAHYCKMSELNMSTSCVDSFLDEVDVGDVHLAGWISFLVHIYT